MTKTTYTKMNRLYDQVPLLPVTISSPPSSSGVSGLCQGQNNCLSMDKSGFACLDRRKRLQTFLAASVIFLLLLLAYTVIQSHFPLTSTTPALPSSSSDLHYSVVVDAGSSGSRAYLYAWPTHSGDPHELLQITPLTGANGDPLYKKVTPGLSSFQDNPQDTLSYIRPLLDFALEHIPADRVHETPLYILATAGMRLVEKPKQEAIVARLRDGITQNYRFLFPDGNLEVISGKQEGIYQWLAINYVLGKFRGRQERKEMVVLEKAELRSDRLAGEDSRNDNLVFRPRTVGAIDMGGASMQIAMEVTSQLQMQGMSEHEKSQVAEINLGCRDHDTEHTYRIFVTTFLGYGANEALARHRRDLILSQIEKAETLLAGFSSTSRISDPCMPLDATEDATVTFVTDQYNISAAHKQQLETRSQVFLRGTGDWELCYKLLKDFTKRREKFAKCEEGAELCHDAGIKVPMIQFEKSEFYGFSEFWYSMEDVLKMGGPYIYSRYQPAAKEFCQIPWTTTLNKFQDGQYPKADRQRIETQCFKSAWLTVALHEGFGFPTSYSHLAAAPETVNGQVVHWTVGALLYRTRFIPLREIEAHAKEQVHHGPYHSPWASGYLYSHYVVFVCLVLVVGAIVLYLERLKRYFKPSTLRKVPSMSFWIPSSSSSDLLSRSSSAERDDERLLSVVSTGGGDAKRLTEDFTRKLFYT